MVMGRRAREDPPMDIPEPSQLLDRVRTLPAGRALLERIGNREAVFLVGGAVRDLILGREPPELDLTVEGAAGELARVLGGTVVAHESFGTCKVLLDGHRYDIATARTESYEAPGALPRVEPATLREDLGRRDFTVNAIAMPLGGARAGTLEALPGALEDLAARTLRVLHDESFLDDPTRLWRLCRYAGRLRFSIEPHTRELALAATRSGALDTVSGARTGAELRLLAREDDPLASFAVAHELGLDRALHPRFGLNDPGLARAALELLPPEGRRDLLVLAAASEDVPQAELRQLLERLAFRAADRERIVAVAGGARPLSRALARARSPAQIAAAANDAPPELVALAGAHGAADRAAAWLETLRHVVLEIDGGDLLAAGVPRGPLIGRALQAALRAKLDGRVHGRDDELSEALKAVSLT
jgi:tRNA nucleotidyltransferase (CCA-adding enzyme)